MRNNLTEYYKSRCTSAGKETYDLLFQGFHERKQCIGLPNRPSEEETEDAIRAVMEDHPEIFWVNCYEGGILTLIDSRAAAFEPKYFLSKSEISEAQDALYSWQHRVREEIPIGYPAENAAWTLCDYLARLMHYKEQGLLISHTLYGAFHTDGHIGVCEGIAKSYKFLADSIGLPCIVVNGSVDFGDGGGGHAWNLVRIHNRYYHVDVVRELDPARIRGKAATAGFLMNENHMSQYQWDQEMVPSNR